ncbi:MAG: hypothetical protein DRP45_05860 [Candidatus Zixiibacteriota bacterium]|nr:MAG: hypothetical protein DRP45_05860 [candidate division Zixibacteria bacterium]
MQNRELQEYYRARAPEYEQIYYRDNPQRRAEIDEQAGLLRDLVKGKDVLELACGTGYWTKIMSETASSIMAVDSAPEMLVEARKKTYRVPVEFAEADMFTESFGSDKYDIVALGFWFSHQPKQEYDRLFEVLAAPLKKTGQIWMIDNNPPAEGPEMRPVGIDHFGNKYKKRFLDNGEEYVILKNYFSRDDLVGYFEETFEIVSLVHKTCYWSAILKPL